MRLRVSKSAATWLFVVMSACVVAGATPPDVGQQILDQASALRQNHQFNEAIAAYLDLISQPGMPPDITNRARLEKTLTAIEKATFENPHGWPAAWQTITIFWVTSAKAIVTVLLWIVVLAIAAGVGILARHIVPARNGLLVDVYDLSSSDRDNASRMLSSEISQVLSGSADSDLNDELILESMAEGDGSGSAAIRPMVQLPGLDSMLSPTANVAIGPLQFTPAALLALLRNLAQPRYQRTLTGALFTQNTRTVIMVQLMEKGGATVRDGSWQIGLDGPDARQILIRRIAARTIVAQANDRSVTTNPRSLESVLEGITRLNASSGIPGEDVLRATAQCFQTALSHDPDNWLARFNLSVLSRQLGDSEFAIQNCEMLEAAIQGKNPPVSLQTYLTTHPTFIHYVRYNRALALSKIPNWSANKAAVDLFEQVVATEDIVLALLAKSANAAALVFQMDRLREAGATDRVTQVREAVVAIATELEQPQADSAPPRVLALARSVAWNAKGAVLAAEGDSFKARRALEAACALQPNFVDPHINLGRLYRRAQEGVAQDWVVRAKGHLKAAIVLQPFNREANYQMGRLLDSKAVLDYAGALQCFDRAAPHSMAAYFASQIYCDPSFAGADLAKGLDQLRASVALAFDVDFRLASLIDRLLDAAKEQSELAKSTLAQLTALVPRQPGSPLPNDVRKLCDRAQQLLTEAERAVKRLAKALDAHEQQRAAKAKVMLDEIRQQIPA